MLISNLSILSDLLPFPFIVCHRQGEIIFASRKVDKTLGVKIKLNESIDLVFKDVEKGQSASSLIRNYTADSIWKGSLSIRNLNPSDANRTVRAILKQDLTSSDYIWIIFTDNPQVESNQSLKKQLLTNLSTTLIQNSKDFIILRDQNGCILHTNQSFDEFLGLPYNSSDKMLTFDHILSPSTAKQMQLLDEKVSQIGERIVLATMQFETKDGKSRQVRIIHDSIKVSEGVTNVFVTIIITINNTQVSDTEMSTKNPNDSESALDSKSQFIASILHDICNPVNAIQGLCETQLELMTESPTEMLTKILSFSREISLIVKDVLDFSRLEHGKFLIEKVGFNPIQELDLVSEQFQNLSHRKGILLAILANPKTPYSVLGDPLKFRRIISNLIGNAVKFTETGHVIVELEFTYFCGRMRAQVTVDDTGVGISENKIQHIFEPFIQGDSSTLRLFGGSGLGLSIVRSLTHAMDGNITVTSQEGKGSKFIATFMLDQDFSATTPYLPKLSNHRILVVGGQIKIREWLTDCLNYWGASCVQIETSEEAEELLNSSASHPFDYVIIDMPDDVNPRLPDVRNGKLILITSQEFKFRTQVQIQRPIRLTELMKHFISEIPTIDIQKAQNLPHTHRRLRVLVAEDNEVNREVTVNRLRRAGHDVSATVDGSAALDLWRIKEFDVAILDIQMPIMDGLMVANAIRSEEEACGRRRTALLALTGLTDSSFGNKCFTAGFDQFLQKPMLGADLIKEIEKLPIAQSNDINIQPEDEFITKLKSAELDEKDDLRTAAFAYIKYALSIIDRLRAARDSNNVELIEREVHNVKGMLFLMSSTKLAQLANGIEKSCPNNLSLDKVNQLIDGLQSLYERLISRKDF